MIKIENLSKKYGKKEVLKSIDISFENGKIYGLVGENGSGKTTLFRCITGLENYKGEISSGAIKLKDSLGVLFTDPFFFSKITGKEYIQLLSNARGETLQDIEEKNIFDLPLNEFASNYSTGMKKKLALLAILLQENQYYILDEPFNGIDIQSNIILTEIIHKLRDLGKTVIMSSHIFSTLSDTCDVIYLLDNGSVIKRVFKDDFSELEQEMKLSTIGNKIEKLAIR